MIGHKVSSISNYVATAVSQSHGLTPILNQHNLYFFDQNISKYTMCYIGATHISIFQIIRTIFYWTHNTDPDGLKNPWVPCIPTPMYMGFPYLCLWVWDFVGMGMGDHEFAHGKPTLITSYKDDLVCPFSTCMGSWGQQRQLSHLQPTSHPVFSWLWYSTWVRWETFCKVFAIFIFIHCNLWT